MYGEKSENATYAPVSSTGGFSESLFVSERSRAITGDFHVRVLYSGAW
jgi:hypothetical protein